MYGRKKKGTYDFALAVADDYLEKEESTKFKHHEKISTDPIRRICTDCGKKRFFTVLTVQNIFVMNVFLQSIIRM